MDESGIVFNYRPIFLNKELSRWASQLSATIRPHLGGVVQITKEPFGDREIFDAFWAPDFEIRMHLLSGAAQSDTFEGTMRKVRQWDPEISKVYNLGEWTLYKRMGRDGFPVVALKQEDDYQTPIRASEVPVGSALVRGADVFFMFFRGKDSVGGLGRLLKNS